MFCIGHVVTFVHYGFNGIPDRATAVQFPEGAGWKELSSVAWEVEQLLKKSDAANRTVPGSVLLQDTAASASWPTLWSHLTQTKWEDGTTRVTSSLLIFEQDGLLKIMLRDRSAGLCLWLACHRLSDAFDAVELSLNDPSAEWRVDRQAAGDQAKRVKPSGSRKS